MGEKMTLEEVNAELALLELKRREKLLRIARGENTWTLTWQTCGPQLVSCLPVGLLAFFLLTDRNGHDGMLVVFVLLSLSAGFSQSGTEHRRLDALIELLDLNKPSPLQSPPKPIQPPDAPAKRSS
jgi:hypothetical protein